MIQLASIDDKTRNAMAMEHWPLVVRIASAWLRRRGHRWTLDELCGYGFDGLLDAVVKFDASRGLSFGQYASTRIFGAMVDGIRRASPFKRLGHVRDNAIAAERLTQELGRTPTADERAARNIGPDEPPRLLSLDQSLEDVFPRDILTARDETTETNEWWEEMCRGLGRKHARVLVGLYREGRTMVELQAEFDVSESRISQLHGQAIALLRARMREAGFAVGSGRVRRVTNGACRAKIEASGEKERRSDLSRRSDQETQSKKSQERYRMGTIKQRRRPPACGTGKHEWIEVDTGAVCQRCHAVGEPCVDCQEQRSDLSRRSDQETPTRFCTACGESRYVMVDRFDPPRKVLITLRVSDRERQAINNAAWSEKQTTNAWILDLIARAMSEGERPEALGSRLQESITTQNT